MTDTKIMLEKFKEIIGEQPDDVWFMLFGAFCLGWEAALKYEEETE